LLLLIISGILAKGRVRVRVRVRSDKRVVISGCEGLSVPLYK